jgi:hypothetical protein
MSLIPFAPFFTAPFFALLPRSRTRLDCENFGACSNHSKVVSLGLPRREDRKQRLPQNPFPIKIEQCERYNKIFLNESGNI